MMSTKPTLVVIVGPTGSGKTNLSIEIARSFNAPIISTDSRQIYRGLAIGTAQPDPAQLAAVKHYMIANHEVEEHYSCGNYEQEALLILDELFKDRSVVVAVGGSGLYIDALCDGMDQIPSGDTQLRGQLKDQCEKDGLASLLSQLEVLDPEYYAEVDHANKQRVIRALEVTLSSGQPFSSYMVGAKSQRPFNVVKVGTLVERSELYDRINRRVDLMVDSGLESEARLYYSRKDLNSLQTVGYREFFSYFDGEITRSEAIELIKRNSRRYAKRQMTWFNRYLDVKWFSPQLVEEVKTYIKSEIGKLNL